MARELKVAPEVAELLPATHLAQLESDVASEDNVCVACGSLIEGAAAELVVLHDERTMLARLAHPDCVSSGIYEWEGTSAAAAELTLRPDGVDVATALVWRPAPTPRAIVLIEPRIHISLDDGEQEPLERLFAGPLGLAAVSGSIRDLSPPPVETCRLRVTDGGLAVESEALRVTVPANAETLGRWRQHVDDGRALLILGRGLGITRPDEELAARLTEALRLRPCWGATLTVG